MFAHELFVRSDVHTVNLVVGDVAMNPLDLWSKFGQYTAGFLRDRVELFRSQFSRSGNFAFNNVFGHVVVGFVVENLTGVLEAVPAFRAKRFREEKDPVNAYMERWRG